MTDIPTKGKHCDTQSSEISEQNQEHRNYLTKTLTGINHSILEYKSFMFHYTIENQDKVTDFETHKTLT